MKRYLALLHFLRGQIGKTGWKTIRACSRRAMQSGRRRLWHDTQFPPGLLWLGDASDEVVARPIAL
eukprot:8030526-Lingulodinium_polyedra.AAC.1